MTDIDAALQAFRDIPADNGDMLLITDRDLLLPIAGAADTWDPQLRRNLASVLRGTPILDLHIAISRPLSALLPQDFALVAELREELVGSGITVHPLHALPAAA